MEKYKVLITTKGGDGIATSIVEFISIRIAREAIETINRSIPYGYTQKALLLNDNIV